MKEMAMDWIHSKEANNQHYMTVPRVESTRDKEEGMAKEILENSYRGTPKGWHDVGTTKGDCQEQSPLEKAGGGPKLWQE